MMRRRGFLLAFASMGFVACIGVHAQQQVIGAPPEALNMRLVGTNDLQGRAAYQPTIHHQGDRWIAYIGHHGGTDAVPDPINPLTGKAEPNGTSIVDVTDPAAVEKLFAVRIVTVAFSMALMALPLAAPFIDILIARGGWRWLGAYGLIVAMGATSAALAVALSAALFRLGRLTGKNVSVGVLTLYARPLSTRSGGMSVFLSGIPSGQISMTFGAGGAAGSAAEAKETNEAATSAAATPQNKRAREIMGGGRRGAQEQGGFAVEGKAPGSQESVDWRQVEI